MKYLELVKESNEELKERYDLVSQRVAEIAADAKASGIYADYFERTANYLMLLNSILAYAAKDEIRGMEEEKAADLNRQLFAEVCGKAYDTSYLNPSYAAEKLGKEAGQILSMLFMKIQECRKTAVEGNIQETCIYSELFVELYGYFSAEEVEMEWVKETIYSFMHDYTEVFREDIICRMVNPDYDYYKDIVMDADLSNTAYLYRYGRYVGENEIGIAKFLNACTEEEIQSMADTYTEGYRMGFVATQKDLSKKSIVEVRYPMGFERMARAAAKNFEKMNLRCVFTPFGTSANKQADYDHREDHGLWMNKSFIERSLESSRAAFEKYKLLAAGCAGPAVIEVFGETPFSPETKENTTKLDEKQQKLMVYYRSEFSRMTNEYIKGEERSFTIIAYPVPEIGEKFEEIFAETVKLNTLDYALYRDMQQKIIDVLDQAEKVHIVGINGNKTDLYVSIYPLKDPKKETAFENCVADVNIPVGEVFTSPVLKGTTGKLHVSQVYLREYNFLNLEIDFVDGMIEKYTCTNFDSEEENQKYIKENILYRHKTLPMGEFAIGTNTTAYKMAREYDIAAKLPILIAEKTGPHFAVGDTCYTYDEDNITYNPDGKAIVARENEISALRKEDISKAYYNCHTDITIPYDELGRITVIKKDGSTEDIIVDGKFVVAGTEELNRPLEEMQK